MKYLNEFAEGDRISGVFLCKKAATLTTKNGKEYMSLTLMDKTANTDAKIWEPNSDAIGDFDELDYIDVQGDVTVFNGAIQVNIRRLRRADDGEYDPSDYLPMSPYDAEGMYTQLKNVVETVKNPFLNRLLKSFFVEDAAFVDSFRKNSAAKTVHHGFVGGLIQHTLAVTRLCKFYTKAYPVLDHDLLISAALLHDIGKVRELTRFPENDYSDDGQLLGHIYMGAEMVAERVRQIEGFPPKLLSELQHCILAHHGELEYGSPKTPELIEAYALHMADNTDAKMETFTEALNGKDADKWLGVNRPLGANIRRTSVWTESGAADE
ncbi:MAG: HD domain-containing protein [Lachnospiraceae bacterium]|nr:HD domain-containing protein [Lachnospiraceae bacterium]MBQ5535077.1 HD domain-containing protein [Lachnospiraceae bacterium]